LQKQSTGRYDVAEVDVLRPDPELTLGVAHGRGAVAAADSPFYIGAAQFDYWRHTQLIIDVVPGRGGGFSLEAPEGVRFLTRSRVFTDDEAAELEATGESPRAD
jgi:uncharacterized protein (DUF779 family)